MIFWNFRASSPDICHLNTRSVWFQNWSIVYMTHQMLIPEQLEFIKELDAVQVEVTVDKGRLTQVITNFLNNASKFTKTGYIKLGYRYLSESDRVAIYVEDTGRGIELSEQKMIFSRFYKQDEFSQGAGLGLSICQVIVEKLRGKIELWSEPGKGSRFTVVLPGVRRYSTTTLSLYPLITLSLFISALQVLFLP